MDRGHVGNKTIKTRHLRFILGRTTSRAGRNLFRSTSIAHDYRPLHRITILTPNPIGDAEAGDVRLVAGVGAGVDDGGIVPAADGIVCVG